MMGSTASWASMAAITRNFTGEIHTFEIVFFRSLFGTVFLLPWLSRIGLSGLRTQRIGMHMARGFVGLATIFMSFTAIALVPLGEVAAILSTRPVIGSLGAVLILHEVSRGHRWAATALAFAGALIIMRPGFSDVSLGVALALLSVIGLAAELLIVKSLTSTEAPDTIVIWQMVVFTPFSLIPAIFVWQTPDIWQFILLVGTGLFGTFTQRCLTRAYAAADATVVLPFDFTRLVFSALLGFLVFAEFPDIWTWAGGALIFAAVLWMARLETQEDTPSPPAI
jgi:drug/metabolite transporter (DMT)-like permease